MVIKHETTIIISTRHFLQKKLKCTKHMSIHDCPKWNGIQDRLQGFSRWEGKQCEEKDIGHRLCLRRDRANTLSLKFYLLPTG
jgi:hypothetical protein